MSPRIIAIFTGNRSEYGLQYPILRAIDAHPALDYRLIVSGAHLDEDFGRSLDEIHDDGFHVDAEVKIEMNGESLFAAAQAIGSGVLSISRTLMVMQPDLLVAYGDRFESFAAVIAASQMNIPTAHIEGGDLTEGGALDDSVRHAMSKLAHLHFTTNVPATNRVLGLGEEAWRVHTVGFPGNDLVAEGCYPSPVVVSECLGLNLARPIVVFTQHAVTTEPWEAPRQIAPSLAAIRELAAEGVQVITTYPNNDAGGRSILQALESIAAEKLVGVQVHRSLGRALYYSLLALAKDPAMRVVCLGNSSSGIKETPAFGCPAVNIGSRQKGRLRGENVIDVGYAAAEIAAAVRYCSHNAAFRAHCRQAKNPYGSPGAGQRIADCLAEVPLGQELLRKRMTLRGETKGGWFR